MKEDLIKVIVTSFLLTETVTISSDEEECSDVNMSGAMSAPATPASLPSRSPSHAGEQTECPESPLIPNIPLSLKKIDKTRVKKMEDAVCIDYAVHFLCTHMS